MTIPRLEAWLDESRDYGSCDGTEKNDLLRKARGLVMEAMTALQPKKLEPAREITQLGEGLTSERSIIYETTTEESGWTNGMLFAIITAKRMGVENFEITVKEEKSRRPRHPNPSSYMSQVMFGGQEEWQSSGGITHMVTIYALRIK